MLPLLALLACAPKYAPLGPIAPDQLHAPLPVRHAQVMGMDLAYVDSGGPGEPLVLIHGLSSYMGFWEHQVEALAGSHRVLALDLPGFGQSARPDAPYTMAWYAEVVSQWMSAVDAPRATVVGHSMGGQIAMTLALDHPERVERLVLSAPAGFERFEPGAADFMKGWWTESRALDASEEEVRANFVAMVFNRVDPGVERLIEERVRLGQHPAFRGTSVAVSRSIAGMVDGPVWDRLPELRVPTLVVFGTDDKMIPNPVFTGGRTRTVAEAGVARLPDAKLVLIPGAGHTVHHDAPEAFNEALLEFVR